MTPTTMPARRHARAAAVLLTASALWLLHLAARPACPDGYVRFDFGLPVGLAVVCGGLGAYQLVRTRFPSREGVVAAALAVLAVLPLLLALAVLVAVATGQYDDCWTF